MIAISGSTYAAGSEVQPAREAPRLLTGLTLRHGPLALLGRFFLVASDRLASDGISIEFASFDEIVALHRDNRSNWAFFNPMFDPTVSDIPDGRAFCIACRDRQGRIIGTVAAKLFDAEAKSLKDIVDSGEFYGVRPADNARGISAKLETQEINGLRGKLVFCGGIWVDPAMRGHRMASLLGKLVNAVALTLWNPDYSLGLVRVEAASTDYLRRYGYTHTAPSLFFYENGRMTSEAVMIWMHADDVALDIARCLDTLWPQVDAAVVAGGGQHTGELSTAP